MQRELLETIPVPVRRQPDSTPTWPELIQGLPGLIDRQLDFQERYGEDPVLRFDLKGGQVSVRDRRYDKSFVARSFPFQIIGFASARVGRWVWGWAFQHPGMPRDLLREARRLRRLAREARAEPFLATELELTDWPADRLARAAAAVCGYDAVLRRNAPAGTLYVMVRGSTMRQRRETTVDRVLSVIATLRQDWSGVLESIDLVEFLRSRRFDVAAWPGETLARSRQGHWLRIEREPGGSITRALSLNDRPRWGREALAGPRSLIGLLERMVPVGWERQREWEDHVGCREWRICLKSGVVRVAGKEEIPLQMVGESTRDERWFFPAGSGAASGSLPLRLRQIARETSIKELTRPDLPLGSGLVEAFPLALSAIAEADGWVFDEDEEQRKSHFLLRVPGSGRRYVPDLVVLFQRYREVIGRFAFNHERTLASYLDQHAFDVECGSRRLEAQQGSWKLTATFDDLGRLYALRGEGTAAPGEGLEDLGLSESDAAKLRALVRGEIERDFPHSVMGASWVALLDGDPWITLGLGDLVRECRRRPTSDWPVVVARWFQRQLGSRARVAQLQDRLDAEIARQLAPHVPRSWKVAFAELRFAFGEGVLTLASLRGDARIPVRSPEIKCLVEKLRLLRERFGPRLAAVDWVLAREGSQSWIHRCHRVYDPTPPPDVLEVTCPLSSL